MTSPKGPTLPKTPPPRRPGPKLDHAARKKLADESAAKLKNAEDVSEDEETDLLKNYR